MNIKSFYAFKRSVNFYKRFVSFRKGAVCFFVNKCNINGSFPLLLERSVNFQKQPFVNGTLPRHSNGYTIHYTEQQEGYRAASRRNTYSDVGKDKGSKAEGGSEKRKEDGVEGRGRGIGDVGEWGWIV